MLARRAVEVARTGRGEVDRIEELVGGEAPDVLAALRELVDQMAMRVGLGPEVRRHHRGQLALIRRREPKLQAAAEERGRKLALAVARDNDERERAAPHPAIDYGRGAVRVIGQNLDSAGLLLDASELRNRELAVFEDM